MDFTAALPVFLITLREGVEAALVVGIVLACLGKANASHLNGAVYQGVFAGLGVSLLLGIGVNFGLQQLGLSSWMKASMLWPSMASFGWRVKVSFKGMMVSPAWLVPGGGVWGFRWHPAPANARKPTTAQASVRGGRGDRSRIDMEKDSPRVC